MTSRRDRGRGRRALAALLLVAAGCAARLEYPEPRNDVEGVVFPICERHGVVCVADEKGTEFGKFSYRDVDFGFVTIRAGVVRYQPSACAADLVLCEFVIHHEVGHLRAGSDQTDADCYAMRFASTAATVRAIEWMTEHKWLRRASALRQCLEEHHA